MTNAKQQQRVKAAPTPVDDEARPDGVSADKRKLVALKELALHDEGEFCHMDMTKRAENIPSIQMVRNTWLMISIKNGEHYGRTRERDMGSLAAATNIG